MSLEVFKNQNESFALLRSFRAYLPFINDKSLASIVQNSTDYSNMLRILHVISYYTDSSC
jgi:hypothetical protein